MPSGVKMTYMSLLALLLPMAIAGQSVDYRGCRLIALTDLAVFEKVVVDERTTVYSTIVYPEILWDEMVPSWNIDLPSGATATFRASAMFLGGESKAYNLGTWSLASTRQSENKQADADGDVLTDTLVVKRPGAKLKLSIEIRSPWNGEARARLIALSFRDSKAEPPPLGPNRVAWGRVIEAPRRSQMSYPNGKNLCSPTAVSMILAHWASVLRRPDLDKDVPEVEKGVHDPNWPGTGNWPFNTAYAGSLPGMRGYIARLSDISELEEWTAAGFPVACSVRSQMLVGKPKGKDDGHLVVLVGFTREGDAVVNDPGWSKEIRQVYKRAHFDAAWKESGRTVYLIHPEDRKPPRDRFGHWVGHGATGIRH